MENKAPYNDKNKQHGDWVLHHSNGNVHCKGSFINGTKVGLWEWYYSNGKLITLEFYARN